MELRHLFVSDKDVDAIVDALQAHTVREPFTHSIWCLIVQDRYVEFEKLLASLGSASQQQDEAKDFVPGFAIIRKDQLTARRPLRSESDWTRCFDAWSTGVARIYPHRKGELSRYREMVIEMFRASEPSIDFPIRFDKEARERYYKAPFELDDRSRL